MLCVVVVLLIYEKVFLFSCNMLPWLVHVYHMILMLSFIAMALPAATAAIPQASNNGPNTNVKVGIVSFLLLRCHWKYF